MERYFMLGNKDHQFFDITAAAYVRNFTFESIKYFLFSTDFLKKKTENGQHGHVKQHGNDMQAFENSILNHLIRGNQSFIEETFDMNL